MTLTETPTRRGPRRRAAAVAGSLIIAGALAASSVVTAPVAVAREAPASFADLIETVGPAVVQVTTQRALAAPEGGGDAPPSVPEAFRGGPLEEFFKRFFEGRGPGLEERAPEGRPTPGPRVSGLGSGFIVDPAGIVVTNNHVIDGASEITVTLKDGRALDAEIVGVDPKTDLAVLRVAAETALPAAAWGDSDALRVGDWVVALGNPFGLDGTATAGIVSARGRDIGAGPYDDFIQIDAPINRGNSGGPLFAADGTVVGVNTAIFSPSGGNVGIGFAIPSALAREVVAELIETGKVERGWLGVMIQPVTPDVAESLGVGAPRGALIAGVEADSPADAGGLRRGDVVLSFGAAKIETVRDLTRAAAAAEVGSRQPVTVWRGGETVELDIRVGSAPQTVAAAGERPGAAVGVDALGLAVATLDERTRERFGLADAATGVVVTDVDAAADAARKGVRPGDVIVEANGMSIQTPRDLSEAVRGARDAERRNILMLVERGGSPRFVAVELADA